MAAIGDPPILALYPGPLRKGLGMRLVPIILYSTCIIGVITGVQYNNSAHAQSLRLASINKINEVMIL